MSTAVRAGLRVQNRTNPKDPSEINLDNSYNAAEIRLHGEITENFGAIANFNATFPGSGAQLAPENQPGIMDAIVTFKAVKEFQIWAGRMLVPSDKSNFCGPWFILPWNYPGFYYATNTNSPLPNIPIGPFTNATGRDYGVTVWGNALDDKLKYYAGVYGLQNAPANHYGSARVQYNIIGTEPGYFSAATYYGAKDIWSIGIGEQYQKGNGNAANFISGAIDPNTGQAKDMWNFMADTTFEKNVPGTGTFTLEGQFYKFLDGYAFAPAQPGVAPGPGVLPRFAPSMAYYITGAYLLPDEIGIGKLQFYGRWQQTTATSIGPAGASLNIPTWFILDAGVGYIIKAYFAKVMLTYQHIELGAPVTVGPGAGVGDVQGNSVQLGFQVQKM